MLVIDASVLVALADTREHHHRACRDLVEGATGPLVVPETVVCEVGHLLQARLGPDAEVAFAASLARGELQVEPIGAAGWIRVHELVQQYRDLPLGISDAAVVAITERHEVTEVATLDADFDVVRPAHVPHLTRVPRT